MKKQIIPITIIILLLTSFSFPEIYFVKKASISIREEKKAKEYIKKRFDHEKQQEYLINKHNSKAIVVKIPRCKLPVANCIGGPTGSITIVVDQGSKEYLPKNYSYYSNKITAKFE